MHGASQAANVSRLVLLAFACASTGCAAKTPGRTPTLELLVADADVWSFELFVSGRAQAASELQRCQLSVGDQHFEATLQGDTFSGTVSLNSGANVVTAQCRLTDGSTLQAPALNLKVPLLAPPEEVTATPEQLTTAGWASNLIVYGVQPSLYGAPPLEALTSALDGLRDLGVNTLWLSSAFDAADPFQVRASYGTRDELTRFVEQAHARELRVVVDFEPNHTSDQHRYFTQVSALGQRSHYYDFYERDATGQPTHYFDENARPNLNFRNPEVARYTLAAALYWLQTAHVDGYRVDTAWGVKQRKPDFWPRFRAELKQASPEVWLLAEASARDPYYLAHGFDAVYDWSNELGHHAWENVFEPKPGIAQRLDSAVRASGAEPARVFRFLNGPDTGERFITRHGEPLTRAATAALLTLPGIPCLYAFDEVGAEFLPDQQEGSVQPENAALRDFHKRLITLRRTLPALYGKSFVPLHASEQDDVLVFARPETNGEQSALIALNFGAQPKRLTVALPDTLKLGKLSDVLGKRTLNAGKQVALSLAAYDAQIWLTAAPRKR